jgi:hypothetical protein
MLQFSRYFANFSRKPQSDEKWYKISADEKYMEPDPCCFGLLDPDPYIISTDPDSDPVPDPGLQSDEKWYKISAEKKYMEPDPYFFGLLDPDPYIISTDSDPVPDPGLI